MISADIESNIKQQEITSIRSTFKTSNTMYKKCVFFIWFWFGPSSWFCPLRTGRVGEGGGVA